VSRGTFIPWTLKTYWTKPLQSKPSGVDPPLRYGAPWNDRAVLLNA
jgi:hypothetical protein